MNTNNHRRSHTLDTYAAPAAAFGYDADGLEPGSAIRYRDREQEIGAPISAFGPKLVADL